MIDSLSTTQILAILLGLYFVAAGARLIIDRETINDIIEAMLDNPLLAYLGGLVVFAIGGTMVAIHNEWNGLLQGFVSFAGWAALVEGILLLACGRWFLGIFANWRLSPRLAVIFGAVTAGFGGLLIFGAFNA